MIKDVQITPGIPQVVNGYPIHVVCLNNKWHVYFIVGVPHEVIIVGAGLTDADTRDHSYINTVIVGIFAESARHAFRRVAELPRG